MGKLSIAAPLTAAVALMATHGAAAADNDCSMSFNGGPDVVDAIHKHKLDFSGYDKLCAMLNKEGMAVDITGSSGTLGDQAYSWVTIAMYSLRLGVDGKVRQSSTIIRPAKDTDVDAMFMATINDTLDDIAASPEDMIQSVHEADDRVTRAVTGGGKP